VERDSAKAAERPSISYAVADEIVITMKPDGSERADLVELHGHVHGVQLEPSKEAQASPGANPPGQPKAAAPPSPAGQAADSTAAPPKPPSPAGTSRPPAEGRHR
jgi:uncharacterized membrane protein